MQTHGTTQSFSLYPSCNHLFTANGLYLGNSLWYMMMLLFFWIAKAKLLTCHVLTSVGEYSWDYNWISQQRLKVVSKLEVYNQELMVLVTCTLGWYPLAVILLSSALTSAIYSSSACLEKMITRLRINNWSRGEGWKAITLQLANLCRGGNLNWS